MAGFAIMTRTELLLLIIGGLFVVITLSVMIQVSVFKVSRASGLFRSASSRSSPATGSSG